MNNDENKDAIFENIVWPMTDSIYGAFSKFEGRKMYDIAFDMQPLSQFVEIGCYCGKSSSILGYVAKIHHCNFVTIDNFYTPAPNDIDVRKAFMENMNKFDIKYKLFYMTSTEAAKEYHKKIDLLFVDGDHLYRVVKEDIKNWIPKVKKGGYILFHDYKSSWDSVTKAVDEITNCNRVEVSDSMIVLTKK